MSADATSPGRLPVAPSSPDGSPPDGVPYESSSVAGAILLTVFLPFIALIVALLLRGAEHDPARKRQLTTWAGVSGAYLAVGLLIGIAIFASVASGFHAKAATTSGPCVGGPVIGAAGEPIGGGRYRFPCAISGSSVVRLPS
jgi:hypothetical protein